MKIPLERLLQHFTVIQLLRPVYLITGDEPLQKRQAIDMIRSQSEKKGFAERCIFTIEAGFDWQQFDQEIRHLSLFSEKKLIELHFTNNKLDEKGKQHISHYVELLQQDVVVVIIMPKLGKTQKQVWVKKIEQYGVIIAIWPLQKEQLQHWLHTQLSNKQIVLDTEALAFFAEQVEGNLLAAEQEVEKLALLYQKEIKQTTRLHLGLKEILPIIADNAYYDIYQLIDIWFEQNPAHLLHVLATLEKNNTAIALVLWVFAKELRTLAKMAWEKDQGNDLEGILQQYRVFSSRREKVHHFLQHYPRTFWYKMLLQLFEIEQYSKSEYMIVENVWQKLRQVFLQVGI